MGGGLAASAKQAPVQDFFKSAHEDAWRAHLAKVARKSSAPSWVKGGYADGKFKSSIWSYIPQVAAEYATTKSSFFKDGGWVSLDNLDEQLKNANPELKSVYTRYGGANWNALVFRNFVLNALRRDTDWFAEEQMEFAEKQVGEDFLRGMVDYLKTEDELKDFSSELDNALADIKIYARDLQLYDYLRSVKKIIWKNAYRNVLFQKDKAPEKVKNLDVAPGVSGSFYFDKTGGKDMLCGFVEFGDFKFRKPSPKNEKKWITLNNGTLRRYFVGEPSKFIVDYLTKEEWKNVDEKSEKSDDSDDSSDDEDNFDAKIAFLPVNDEFECKREKKLGTSDYFGIKFENGEKAKEALKNMDYYFKKFCDDVSYASETYKKQIDEFERDKKRAQERLNTFEEELKKKREKIKAENLNYDFWENVSNQTGLTIYLSDGEKVYVKNEAAGKLLDKIKELKSDLTPLHIMALLNERKNRSIGCDCLLLTKEHLGYIDNIEKRIDADIKCCDDKEFLEELLSKLNAYFLSKVDEEVVKGNNGNFEYIFCHLARHSETLDDCELSKFLDRLKGILDKVYEFCEKRKGYISDTNSKSSIFNTSYYNSTENYTISDKSIFSKDAKNDFERVAKKEREELQTALLYFDKYDQLDRLRSSLDDFRKQIEFYNLSGLLKFEEQIPQDAETIKQPAQSMEDVENQLKIFKDYKKRISNLMSLRIKLGSEISEPDAYKIIGWHLEKTKTKKKKK